MKYSDKIKIARAIKKNTWRTDDSECSCTFDHDEHGKVVSSSGDECFVGIHFTDDLWVDGGYGDVMVSDEIDYRWLQEYTDRIDFRLPQDDDENPTHKHNETLSIINWVMDNKKRVVRRDGRFSNEYTLLILEPDDEIPAEFEMVEPDDLAYVHQWDESYGSQCGVNVQTLSEFENDIHKEHWD